MWKWAIKDYFGRFRWQVIREKYKKGGWWVYLYFMTVIPMVGHMFERKEQLLTYYLMNVPILFCIFAASLHSIALPKMMYLCPMSTAMRKKYIKAATIMHICVPMLIGMCGACTLLLLDICDPVLIVGAAINIVGMVFAMSTGSGLRLTETAEKRQNAEREGENHTENWGLELAGLIAAMIADMFFVFMMEWKDVRAIRWLGGTMTAGCLLIQGAIMVKFFYNWNSGLEQAIQFEGGK